ncbi:MAG: hypothetical protein JWO22_2763 [Frankiales bacterium]|nr:hypothetical protein [Frankiales bacterium]
MHPGLARLPRAARLLVAGAVAASVVTALPAVAAAPKLTCTGSPTKALPTSKVLGLSGSYVLPAKAPTALVVFAHGYRSWSGAWQQAMVEAASKHNAIAVAVDYRGLRSADESHGGWPAKAGSEDLVKVVATFAKACRSITTKSVFSVGMGGDVAGLAIARDPSLFTYWVDVEGATDLYDLWTSLSAVGGVCLPTGTCLPGLDTYYASTRSDLEEAAGGAPYAAKAGYDALDAATQLRAAPSLGLHGVAVVHAVADGSVLLTEGAELRALMQTKSVPSDLYAVGNGNGGPDRTIPSEAGVPGLPLAGAEPDGANGDVVIRTGLGALWRTVDKGGAKPSGQVVPVNG